MNISELLGFITPQPEPLQLTFFIIILAMFFGTIFSTHLSAKNAAWEKNWNNGTSEDCSDDLDIDHGSVTDLWHAVETKSEKMAEIMPGMLLVVGLLGTFLGLGLALNHASNILGQSNAVSAAGAANSMQDLMSMMQGLGTKFKTSTWGITFFLLLKVWSSWTGFDEKRLTWVIRKVKTELERRKAQEQTEELNKQQRLYEQINLAAGLIVQGFALNLDKLSESQKSYHQQTLQFMGRGIQTVRGDLASINTAMQSDNAILKQVLEQGNQGVREDLASINAATQTSGKAMASFVDGTKTIIKDMSVASNKMADGAREVGVAGSSLVKAVDEFSNQFKQVLGDVRTDLSTAINDMSKEAAQTLEQGTKELGKATHEISVALGKLSQDVNTTMNGVKGSIEESLKIQVKSGVLFTQSSRTLNENVTATTELVNKLGADILSGLEAVSESGQRMDSIGKSLKTIVPQMGDLLPALEPLKTLHVQYQPLLDEAKAMRTDILIIGKDIHSDLQAVSGAGLQLSMIEKSLEAGLKEMHHLRKAVEALPQVESPIKLHDSAQS